MSPKYLQFGRLLREIRRKKGIETQDELARLLVTSQQSVSRWEAGTHRPRANEVPKLAVVLNVPVEQLLQAAGYSPEASSVSFDRPLPLASLQADSFERFCTDLIQARLGGTAVVHQAGKTGHKQFGIDIEASLKDGEYHTFQCKREASFGPAKVKAAVAAQTIGAAQKYILLSRVASPDARNEIKQHSGWDIWDGADLTRMFRELPKQDQVRIVDIYFRGQRFALTGELEAGPWETVDAFFGPHLLEGGIFTHSWDLVGRVHELDELAAAFDAPATQVACLVGRAGEGKSRVLRAVLERFANKFPSSKILVASPTEEISAKSLEDLGNEPKLLVVDDVHDRSTDDLIQLFRYVLNPISNARLLLVYRPYWGDVVKELLAGHSLVGDKVVTVTLARPTKKDAVELAEQVLSKLNGPVHAAKMIADVAYDSPLAVVVGAQIVAREGLHPELIGSSEAFRFAVLKRYERMIAEGLAKDRDQDRIHSILRVLALVQPIVPEDPHTIELLERIEDIRAPDANRLVRLLIDGGVIFKRGAKYRLSPDLLADSIIETHCINLDGSSNGYAERVFEAAIPEHKEHLLLNLGRLDWRRNEGDTSSSPLLDQLWAQLRWQDDYVNADIKAAVAAAYFQPKQALLLASRLIGEGRSADEVVFQIIRNAAYNLKHLPEALDLLWECGKSDDRPTHQFPNHPLRILTEIATSDPRKPVEFVETAVDFAIDLLEYDDSWGDKNTPFDVLEGALKADGHFTSSVSYRAVTYHNYTVPLAEMYSVRLKIIDAIIVSLDHHDLRRAYEAAKHLANALRAPMNEQRDRYEDWVAEFERTLKRVLQLLQSKALNPVVLVEIAGSVRWHASCGSHKTSAVAQQIIGFLDQGLVARTIRALMDPWGTSTWPINEEASDTTREEYIKALCDEMNSTFKEPRLLDEFLSGCCADIVAVAGAVNQQALSILSELLIQLNPALAHFAVAEHLAGRKSRMSDQVGLALACISAQDRAAAFKIVEKMLEHPDQHLSVIAEAYARMVFTLGEVSVADRNILQLIFQSSRKEVVWYAPRIARQVFKIDKSLAVDLIMSVKFGEEQVPVHDFFMWIAHDLIDQVDPSDEHRLLGLVDSLRHVRDLDDYWVNVFLRKVIARNPAAVLNLAKFRIEDSVASEDWGLRGLGSLVRNQSSLDLMAHTDGPKLLRDLLDWSLERINDYGFRYRFTELIELLCSPFEAAFLAALEGWLENGSAKHFDVVAAILQEADQSFVIAQGEFVARVLKTARRKGKAAHRGLMSAFFSASISGVRSGIPGQPFPIDVQLKEFAEQRLADLTSADPTFELYTNLKNHASQEIERQLREGRLMDEEEEEAG